MKYLKSFVDKVLGVELRKDPPNGLHEVDVHRLVIALEVNPAASACNHLLPLLHVARDDAPAFLVVPIDPHFKNILSLLNP